MNIFTFVLTVLSFLLSPCLSQQEHSKNEGAIRSPLTPKKSKFSSSSQKKWILGFYEAPPGEVCKNILYLTLLEPSLLGGVLGDARNPKPSKSNYTGPCTVTNCQKCPDKTSRKCDICQPNFDFKANNGFDECIDMNDWWLKALVIGGLGVAAVGLTGAVGYGLYSALSSPPTPVPPVDPRNALPPFGKDPIPDYNLYGGGGRDPKFPPDEFVPDDIYQPPEINEYGENIVTQDPNPPFYNNYDYPPDQNINTPPYEVYEDTPHYVSELPPEEPPIGMYEETPHYVSELPPEEPPIGMYEDTPGYLGDLPPGEPSIGMYGDTPGYLGDLPPGDIYPPYGGAGVYGDTPGLIGGPNPPYGAAGVYGEPIQNPSIPNYQGPIYGVAEEIEPQYYPSPNSVYSGGEVGPLAFDEAVVQDIGAFPYPIEEVYEVGGNGISYYGKYGSYGENEAYYEAYTDTHPVKKIGEIQSRVVERLPATQVYVKGTPELASVSMLTSVKSSTVTVAPEVLIDPHIYRTDTQASVYRAPAQVAEVYQSNEPIQRYRVVSHN